MIISYNDTGPHTDHLYVSSFCCRYTWPVTLTSVFTSLVACSGCQQSTAKQKYCFPMSPIHHLL